MIYRKVKHDPLKLQYMDTALEPITDHDTETLEMFQSDIAKSYVNKVQQMDKIRHGEAV